MFDVSLPFLHLTLKPFPNRAEVCAHLRMSYVMITSWNIRRNMRIIPSRLLNILYAICLSVLRVKNPNCTLEKQAFICHCSFPGVIHKHCISCQREITASAFIQNMFCLHCSVLGSYSIYSFMHSHLIFALLLKCSIIYCGVKRKQPQSEVIAKTK